METEGSSSSSSSSSPASIRGDAHMTKLRKWENRHRYRKANIRRLSEVRRDGGGAEGGSHM